MAFSNKLHLRVVKDLNKWFSHFRKSKDGVSYRLHLCGHKKLWGFFIQQYAETLGYKDFMKQFTSILSAMEKDGQSAFSLYITKDED